MIPEIGRTIAPVLGDDWPRDGFGPCAALCAQLPSPRDLRPGSAIGFAAHPDDNRRVGLFRRRPFAHAAVRAAALLARGYVEVSAEAEADGRELVWALVP